MLYLTSLEDAEDNPFWPIVLGEEMPQERILREIEQADSEEDEQDEEPAR